MAKKVKFESDERGGLLWSFQNKEFLLPRGDILFDLLTPDPKNPRYRFIVEGTESGLSPDEMYDLLINDEATQELARSIEGIGGLTDPIIVEPNDKGGYTIREGMRRWAAYRWLRSLQEEKGQPVTWKTMACHVRPPNMDEKTLMIMLGTIHYQGKKHWDAHARAGYIHHLKSTFKMTNEDISAVMGISKAEVSRSLLGYKLSNEHAKQVEKQTGEKQAPKYGQFSELLRQKGAAKAMQDATIKAAVFNGISKAANAKEARHLVEIVKNPKARKALESPGPMAITDALAVLEHENPAACGAFRIMLKTVKDLEANYSDALKHLQKKSGNKAHVDIFTHFMEVGIRLAKDAGRTSIIEKALRRKQQRRMDDAAQ